MASPNADDMVGMGDFTAVRDEIRLAIPENPAGLNNSPPPTEPPPAAAQPDATPEQHQQILASQHKDSPTDTVPTIDKDEPVWFGCDVGKSFHREKGLLQHNVFDFESAFGTGFGMDKRERLLYGESLMTHAMVITAYDREQLTSTWHGRLQRGVGLCCVVWGSGHSLVLFLV
jgi:hypothetical protein